MSKQAWEVYVGTSCTTLKSGLSDIIDVYVPELTPNAMGEPLDHKLESSVIDEFSGAEIKTSVIEKRSIKASFLGRDNHFIPCIHKGEQVIVLRHGGGELNWFWYPFGRKDEHGIRRHEHLRWFAMSQSESINPDGSIKDCEDSNSFFVDINTNTGSKMIHLHTSRADGEPVGYDVLLLPESQMLYIKDTKTNEISIDSDNTIIKLINADKSRMELNKTNIEFECSDTFSVKAGKKILVESPVYENKCTDQTHTGTSHKRSMTTITDEASASLSANGSGSATYKGGSVTIDGAVTVTGGNFTVASSSGMVPVVIVYGSNSWG